MAIIVRHISTYRAEDWGKVLDLVKRWIPIGKRLGVPKDNFCRYISGPATVFSLVNEREYDSMEAWEAGFATMQGDPENDALWEEQSPLILEHRIELLMTIDVE